MNLAMLSHQSSYLSKGASRATTKEEYDVSAHRLLCDLLDFCTPSSQTSIYIKDVPTVHSKIAALMSKGIEALQVVSDFDRTMSKYSHNGIVTPTCHGIFEMDPELTEDAKLTLRGLRDKYYPIEVDPHMSDAEKVPYMFQWWDLSHKTIVESALHRDALAKTVKECGLVLRERVPEFTKRLEQYNIPVLIFSAGLGNVIDLLLYYFSIHSSNLRVVSNFMEFNEEGLLVGFKDPVIHSFNKTAASIANTDYYTLVSSKRPCVLLLGDSTGDVHMADGATTDDPNGISGTVLRIGFLNESVEKNLEKYKSIYDIVLVGDDTFNVPITLLEAILKCHEQSNQQQ